MLWATQKQLSEIFDIVVRRVIYYLNRIFQEGELDEAAVVTSRVIAAAKGKPYFTELYELEAVISLGVRVASRNGSGFWMSARHRAR
jgi:hypothetical protein